MKDEYLPSTSLGFRLLHVRLLRGEVEPRMRNACLNLEKPDDQGDVVDHRKRNSFSGWQSTITPGIALLCAETRQRCTQTQRKPIASRPMH